MVIGPNGSGKTSLIQALLRLRALAGLPLGTAPSNPSGRMGGSAEIAWALAPPFDHLKAVMSCVSETQCDFLQIIRTAGQGTLSAEEWNGLRMRLRSIRAFSFDHHAIAQTADRESHERLSSDGGNLAAVVAGWREQSPPAFAELNHAVCRILPEYDSVEILPVGAAQVQLGLRLAEEQVVLAAEHLSQGTLYVLALLALAHDPNPPAVVCVEEIDRGIHPRLLREVRDALYQLVYPDTGSAAKRTAGQIIATTHSPYLLDLFRDHPEEVVIAEKKGSVAAFSRLSDRTDLAEIMADGALGDLWYSGVLGGVPEAS